MLFPVGGAGCFYNSVGIGSTNTKRVDAGSSRRVLGPWDSGSGGLDFVPNKVNCEMGSVSISAKDISIPTFILTLRAGVNQSWITRDDAMFDR